MKAPITKIIPSSFIDGPGNRMVIFFQGCNLKCLYCHNPETINQCHSCGICLTSCSSDAIGYGNDGNIVHTPYKCSGCDNCINVCPNSSNPKYRMFNLHELFDQVMNVSDFLNGITLSGGECTLYTDFIVQFIEMIKNASDHLSVYIDTNGNISDSDFADLSNVACGFMIDLKAFDITIHRSLTGYDNNIILQNITKASNFGLLYEVRTVVVEGYNDTSDEIISICQFIKTHAPDTRFRLIPFQFHGVKTPLKQKGNFTSQKYFELYKIAQDILGEKCIEHYWE